MNLWRVLLTGLVIALCSFSAAAQNTSDVKRIVTLESLLAKQEKELGREHPSVLATMAELEDLYVAQNDYKKLIAIYTRFMEVARKNTGSEHPITVILMIKLASFYDKQGEYSQAEILLVRALGITEKAQGPEHPDLAVILNNLAEAYRNQGLDDKAAPLYLRAISLWEKEYKQDHPVMMTSMNNLAEWYRMQGLFSKAEPLYQRTLALLEKSSGIDHKAVASVLNNLALVYHAQGRFQDSLKLHERSIQIDEKTLGPNDPKLAIGLNNLAELYRVTGLLDKAEILYQRSLSILENSVGPEHPDVSIILNNIALLLSEKGQHARSASFAERSLVIAEKSYGINHPAVGNRLSNLAVINAKQGFFANAEKLQIRALTISENSLGPNHPDLPVMLRNLAELKVDQKHFEGALEYHRKATKVNRMIFEKSEGSLGLRERSGFRLHLDVIATTKSTNTGTGGADEAFDLIQLIHDNPATKAIAQSVARHWAPEPEQAALVRRQQDAEQRYRHLYSQLIKAIGEPPAQQDPGRVANLRQELSALETQMAENRRSISTQFPDYDSLVSNEPLSLTEAQALLRKGEALLTFAINDEQTHLVLLRQDSATALTIPLHRTELDKLVRRVRATLLADNPLSTTYDAEAAHALYQALFQPLQPHLEGVKDVLVVTEGSLSALPLGVLLESPVTNESLKLQDYKKLDWLAKRYNFAMLPAVISLKALRGQTKADSEQRHPFLGMGDPLLEGHPGHLRGVKGKPGIEFHNLPALPDTADELRAVAQALGATPDALYLREKATETQLKKLPLNQYRVLGLATHGLVAGEGGVNTEPGLVLTPPAKVTEEDDGYLAASEVAQLKLNADWTVLSACNTATSDGTPDAEGLSGLARSFFYAGARSLLVSYWPVVSSAATRLMTDTFRIHAADASVGKLEALRKAMMGMIEDEENPEFAHPTFWAPFMVVGEGR